jgi:asparagine synthase (glutamine-hydrolysing)
VTPQGARQLIGRLGAVYPKLDWAPQFLRAKTTLQALGRAAGEGLCAGRRDHPA